MAADFDSVYSYHNDDIDPLVQWSQPLGQSTGQLVPGPQKECITYIIPESSNGSQ